MNSIPPSRDPKQPIVGVAAPAPTGGPSQVGTPTLGIQPHLAAVSAAAPLPNTSAVAVAVPAAVSATTVPITASLPPPQTQQPYFESASRDSHPIASEELVERLEEISTQQGSPDAAEDAER